MLFIIIPILFEFIFVFVFVSIIVKAVKRYKNIRNTTPPTNEQTTNTTFPNSERGPFIATISNANDENAYWNSGDKDETFCDYCGSKVERVRKRCPSCGAKLHRK